MKKQYLFFVLMSVLVSGCTNVASDVARYIEPTASSHLKASALFSTASDYFTQVGYQCIADEASPILKCTKELRDLYIHQTTAVVEIFPGDEKEAEYILVAERWDEGLIPGEFISGNFRNEDVANFCGYIQEKGLAVCRISP
ncbi:hypothetical protein SAMN05216571_1156 [Onishia taeanensis]|uniref:Lipoprotein n=1 Tax=Onishia taeanensis TaxID=284577 RepID=A0A1G7UK26_9GAMM|nr:hypothetical protein [Halomonas taeanensis]MAX32091.1 hypothetical protein [Halomonadaceae bacterium]SDG47449.1 hypothetical protein SAMN05216571_1156 [Halomonas taeanensis]